MIADFLEKMGKMEILTYVGLDDFADKLNFLFSVWILILFCSITTVKTYFLSPITCYIPSIVGSHEGQANYITNFCYTEGTYNVPLEDFAIDNEDIRWMDKYKDKKIYYYQWLPFLLGIQGILCYIPRIIWYLFANNRAGSDLTQLIKLGNDAHKAESDKREKLVAHITRQFELWIFNTREYKQTSGLIRVRRICYQGLRFCLPSKRLGTWLVFVYFVIKCLYIMNNIGQLYLLRQFLQIDTSNYTHYYVGFQLFKDLASGKDWMNTGVFPRSGCCAIKTRQASHAQYLFAQCSLPVNMINEKIFIFLWFWFSFVLIMTVFSLLIWITRLITRKNRKRIIKKYLYLSDVIMSPDEKIRINNFVSQFLRHDGAFLLNMIALNCGDVITTEICHSLYKTYCEKHQEKDYRGACKHAGADSGCFANICEQKKKNKAYEPNCYEHEPFHEKYEAKGTLLTQRQVSVTPSAPPAAMKESNNNKTTCILMPEHEV